jgi:hypothetical protein
MTERSSQKPAYLLSLTGMDRQVNDALIDKIIVKIKKLR